MQDILKRFLTNSRISSCDRVELHVIKDANVTEGWAHVHLHRDRMMSMMRSALASKSIDASDSRQYQMQSTSIGNQRMERVVMVPGRSRERVESRTLLNVFDLRDMLGLPLVWMEWSIQPLSSAYFPCTTDHDDLRHCIKREVRCGEGVSLFFETNVDTIAGSSAVYRAWLQICRDSQDVDTLITGIMLAFDAIGIMV